YVALDGLVPYARVRCELVQRRAWHSPQLLGVESTRGYCIQKNYALRIGRFRSTREKMRCAAAGLVDVASLEQRAQMDGATWLGNQRQRGPAPSHDPITRKRALECRLPTRIVAHTTHENECHVRVDIRIDITIAIEAIEQVDRSEHRFGVTTGP